MPLPVSLRDPSEANAGRLPPRPSRPAAKSLLRGAPGQQRSCSAPSFSQGTEIPASGCTDRVRGNPVPSRFPLRPDPAADQIRAPPNVPPKKADGLTDRSPAPHHIVVPMCRSGGQRRNAATRVHLPNSPRHHAETSAAGRRPRTGQYECRRGDGVCLAWDFPRGGDAHAVVSAAVWFTPLLTNPDVVAGLRRAAGPFLSDSSTMSPGHFAERLS